MAEGQRRRYGGIVWRAAAPLEEAIRVVSTFHDADYARARVASVCRTGERWAVVDLATKQVVASSNEVMGRVGA